MVYSPHSLRQYEADVNDFNFGAGYCLGHGVCYQQLEGMKGVLHEKYKQSCCHPQTHTPTHNTHKKNRTILNTDLLKAYFQPDARQNSELMCRTHMVLEGWNQDTYNWA